MNDEETEESYRGWFALSHPPVSRIRISSPRQQHEVQVIGSVPLSFVQRRSLLHQTLQSPRVHLQPPYQVVHVCLSGLVVQIAASHK